MKILAAGLCCLICAPELPGADADFFAGASAGISTLSADASTSLTGSQPAASAYKPENGPTVNVYAGWHANGYLSIQGSYFRNSNDVAITGILGNSSYEQDRHSSQDTFAGELLLYFRPRRSWVRPYLSVGAGAVYIESRVSGLVSDNGSLPLPPPAFSATRFAFPVSTGIDLLLKSGWGFRYCFSETMSGNPFGQQLSPPGQRRLANYRNLFGIVKYFGHRT